ncbi:hypothetical protein Bbelb_116180 [Branchiostoma belcheri]|nr:hypothetical protein Bbelb_116180 [Branchiostoma belcheri]
MTSPLAVGRKQCFMYSGVTSGHHMVVTCAGDFVIWVTGVLVIFHILCHWYALGALVRNGRTGTHSYALGALVRTGRSNTGQAWRIRSEVGARNPACLDARRAKFVMSYMEHVPRDRQWVRRGSEVGTEAVDVALAVPVQVGEGEVVSRFKLHHAIVKLNRILLVLNFSRARHRDKVPFLAAFLPDEIVTYTTCVGMFDIATKFPSWWTLRGKFPLGGLDSTRVSALVGLHRLRAGTPLVSAWSTSRELPCCVTWQGTPVVTDLTQEHRSCRPGSGNFPQSDITQ